jgi:hypothetical protein
MIAPAGLTAGDDLALGELARRCRCDHPCLIASEDGARCLKCGRSPAIRLGAATPTQSTEPEIG